MLSGAVVFIVATNNILLYAVTLEQIADKIGAFLFSVTNSRILLLFILNVMLLCLGAVVDCLPPFLAACILVLFLVTYFPMITLWIPNLVMG